MVVEGDRLDGTLKLTEEIIALGNSSGLQMESQREKLKKTGKNLKKIQVSAIPGIDKLLGKIG